MHKSKSRVIKAEMTRKRIYQSALKLFEEEGYDSTTVEKIVKDAGVSKGSFFVYFPKKDYVVLHYFKDLDIYLEEMAKDINAMEEEPTLKIIMFFIRSNEYILRVASINLIKTFYQSQFVIDDKSYLTESNRPVKIWVGKWVREAREKGMINAGNTPEEITDMILTVCRGILFEWCLNNGEFDINERTKKMLNIFFSGLKERI